MEQNNNEIMKPMTLLEKFALSFTKEPQKTFRKLNITNGNDMLTGEGANIFLTWLLQNKHADEFKKNCLDKMVKEHNKETNNK